MSATADIETAIYTGTSMLNALINLSGLKTGLIVTRGFEDLIVGAYYDGGYTAIYPIKVSQHRNVAGELVAQGEHGFGLEAGSKPELLAVLARSRSRAAGTKRSAPPPRARTSVAWLMPCSRRTTSAAPSASA